MRRSIFILCCIVLPKVASAQSYFVELQPMSEAVTNNAVTGALDDGVPYVYSFTGLDSTKIWSGIHLKAWRMNAETEIWESLPPVPDAAGGKIAAGASTVKNRIYVIGGYHVAQNGNETSSNKVHRFDPDANVWLSDGSNIPVAIDDHVQAVWRDSLIYIITGWSNTSNVPNVQIYNPETDVWLAGTSVPNTNIFKAFGASGSIKGDTIFYCGGARDGSNFPATTVFRKGIINPADPTQITWSSETNTLAKGYRMAAATMADALVWLGGSDITYNYDGIAYNGSGGVPALARAKTWFDGALTEINTPGLLPNVMDLRGAAQFSPSEFFIAGGMESGQKVSNKVYRIAWATTVATQDQDILSDIQISPNPASSMLFVETPKWLRLELLDGNGRSLRQVSGSGILTLDVKLLPAGTYFLKIADDSKVLGIKQVLVVRP